MEEAQSTPETIRAFYREALATRSHWIVIVAYDEHWFVNRLLEACYEEVMNQELLPRPHVQVLALEVLCPQDGVLMPLLVTSLPRAALPARCLQALLSEVYGVDAGGGVAALEACSCVVSARRDRLWPMGEAIEAWGRWLAGD